MFQTKVVDEIKTNISFSKKNLENLAFYEIMWRNILVKIGTN
jgi:hypothetical protein